MSTCKWCGTIFQQNTGHIKKYCSIDCKKKAYQKRSNDYHKSSGYASQKKSRQGIEPDYPTKICVVCKSEFKPTRKNAICCSNKCSTKRRKKTIKLWRKNHKKINSSKIKCKIRNPRNIHQIRGSFSKLPIPVSRKRNAENKAREHFWNNYNGYQKPCTVIISQEVGYGNIW